MQIHTNDLMNEFLYKKFKKRLKAPISGIVLIFVASKTAQTVQC